MTLRLVSDNNHPDGVLYCQQLCYPRKAATILVSFCGGPYLPRCDECARGTYQRHPDVTRLAPLAEYVDHYAIAREAALATPGQIIRSASSDIDADDRVCRRMYHDQAVYCRGWCRLNEQPALAGTCLSNNGGKTWIPVCSACAHRWQNAESQAETRPVNDDYKNKLLAIFDEIYANEPAVATMPAVTTASKPVSLGARMVTGSSMLLSFIIGGMLAAEGQSLDAANPAGPLSTPAGAGWTDGGISFILLAVLIGLAWLSIEISRQSPRKPRPAQTVPSSQKAGVSQGYQQGIPVGQLATTAALVGAEVLWHHQIREHQARVRDSALGVAPLNNVHAGIKHATAILAQRQQAQRQQQPAPTLPFGGAGTPHSDIYGNVT
jgi:hypothetical protein